MLAPLIPLTCFYTVEGKLKIDAACDNGVAVQTCNSNDKSITAFYYYDFATSAILKCQNHSLQANATKLTTIKAHSIFQNNMLVALRL
jgi:hypothetical protein